MNAKSALGALMRKQCISMDGTRKTTEMILFTLGVEGRARVCQLSTGIAEKGIADRRAEV